MLLALLVLLPFQLQAQQTSSPDFSSIDRIMATGLAEHKVPGAVVMIGHDGHVVFHKAYENRSTIPSRTPMTEGTIFDVASMTKVMATTTATMQLYQQGRFRLNDPVAKYLPAFAANRKRGNHIRQVMTHYSGLPPDLDLKQSWSGKQTADDMAFAVKPDRPPGIRFVYSDINSIVMGALVEKLSGMTLDAYVAKYVFAPLGMDHTRFLPPASWCDQIALGAVGGNEFNSLLPDKSTTFWRSSRYWLTRQR